MPKKDELNVSPYKGVRDFYPEDWFVETYIWKKWIETAEKFGYVEYSASVLEPSELYAAKTSEEIVKEQSYTFTDRGGREVTLRPEMTPTVARMIAAKRRELSLPLRWFSIPNVFRYERPQRGRLREHWQLNADIFGVSGIEAEVEIISLAYHTMKAFGAKDEDFEIRVNSRAFLHEVYKPILKDEGQFPAMFRLLDKKEKMKEGEFELEWQKLFKEPFKENREETSRKVTEIRTVLEKRGIRTKYDPYTVRGFDYYTDIVFEVFDTNPKNNRSLFGGGRYDNLLAMFGEEPVPAVGFGMGDVTIRDFLETRGLLPEYHSPTQLYICHTDDKFIAHSQELAARLREQGLNVAVDLGNKKVGDQIKIADKQKIPFVICVGEEETKSGDYRIKNLKSRIEVTKKVAEIALYLRANK